ncbi:hypothetical protein J1N35_012326 [Gossypium stocksii]|uniref:Reverse transcriptase zinc-binding domain-containing protein n=1 Tax=Gossypium stocksii TaxID=47602 RepID=A0A9D3W629_9ROSI|nr:hypothetical protein J1N35_012326 [Gossypium stocksii]
MGISYRDWGGSTESVHDHLVKWNQVCRFKSQGGLGLRKARLKNLAMLAKAGWRLHTNQDAAPRLGDTPLCHPLFLPAVEQRTEKVADFINVDGQWNLMVVSGELPSRLKHEIAAVPLPITDLQHTPDSCCWGLESSGKYSIGSAYTCAICSAVMESIDHIFLECLAATELWLELRVPQLQQDFFSLPSLTGCSETVAYLRLQTFVYLKRGVSGEMIMEIGWGFYAEYGGD